MRPPCDGCGPRRLGRRSSSDELPSGSTPPNFTRAPRRLGRSPRLGREERLAFWLRPWPTEPLLTPQRVARRAHSPGNVPTPNSQRCPVAAPLAPGRHPSIGPPNAAAPLSRRRRLTLDGGRRQVGWTRTESLVRTSKPAPPTLRLALPRPHLPTASRGRAVNTLRRTGARARLARRRRC